VQQMMSLKIVALIKVTLASINFLIFLSLSLSFSFIKQKYAHWLPKNNTWKSMERIQR
jgi:hypothetical protein